MALLQFNYLCYMVKQRDFHTSAVTSEAHKCIRLYQSVLLQSAEGSESISFYCTRAVYHTSQAHRKISHSCGWLLHIKVSA